MHICTLHYGCMYSQYRSKIMHAAMKSFRLVILYVHTVYADNIETIQDNGSATKGVKGDQGKHFHMLQLYRSM